MAVHTFDMSCLDYCCFLYCGISKSHIAHLQLVQNSAVRLLARCLKHDHITLTGYRLVREQTFKIILFINPYIISCKICCNILTKRHHPLGDAAGPQVFETTRTFKEISLYYYWFPPEHTARESRSRNTSLENQNPGDSPQGNIWVFKQHILIQTVTLWPKGLTPSAPLFSLYPLDTGHSKVSLNDNVKSHIPCK